MKKSLFIAAILVFCLFNITNGMRRITGEEGCGKLRICGVVIQVQKPCQEFTCNEECKKRFPSHGKSQCTARGYCSESECACFHPCPPII